MDDEAVVADNLKRLDAASAFVWDRKGARLKPVKSHRPLGLDLLRGIDDLKAEVLANTRQFAQGHAANSVLLWGARGMGKSSLVKAVHATLNATYPKLVLIELYRQDIGSLPLLLELLRRAERRCIVFCDDLSFEGDEEGYKSLKAILEGGVEERPDHVLFYATSNRRHLMPRRMIENEGRVAIHASEAIEEKISLSDRFGIWLGFHPCSQNDFLDMVCAYARHFGLEADDDLKRDALAWAATRGHRSGRVAWQFMQAKRGQQQARDDRSA